LASATCEHPPENLISPRSFFERLKPHSLALLIPFVLLFDIFLINLVFRLTYASRFVWHWLSPVENAPQWQPYLAATLFVSLVWTFTMALAGLYRGRPGPSKFEEFVRLAFGLGLGMVMSLAIGFFYRDFSYSRLLMLYGFLFSLLVLGLFHVLINGLQGVLLERGFGTLNTVVVGCNSLGETIGIRLKNHPRLGYRLVGFLPAPGETVEGNPWIYEVNTGDLRKQGSPPFGAILGNAGQLSLIVSRFKVDEVIFALPGASFSRLFELMGQCSEHPHLRFRIVPDMLELVTAKLQIQLIDGIPTLEIHDVPLRKWYNRTLKRAMDITFSLFGLFLLAPLLLLLAIAVKASSPGPVFYRQERLGRDGRIFPLYKFRSMRIDAESRSGPVWAVENDPRTTRVGLFIRRFSIDELPQLFNVLKGDMSLVGPRPERPHFVDQFRHYVPKYMDRHLVRSGLTGWAQINGQRGQEGSIEERTRYDIYYIENWSPLFDLRIILKTVIEVLIHPSN
jgi:exopolysaccharide biosynthesis polyprenyl glycosylphosphotransferase